MNFRNVEIKARIEDVDRIISKAKELSNTDEAVVIKQHDTFFCWHKGRLKIRMFEDKTGEYICYQRPNVLGPKLSTYGKSRLDSEDVEILTASLTQACGIDGVVEKVRQLFIVGQTRIHIDQVEKLGNFVELEVVLREDQDVETGQEIASDLMKLLSITEDDLIAESYIDLLKKTNTTVLCTTIMHP